MSQPCHPERSEGFWQRVPGTPPRSGVAAKIPRFARDELLCRAAPTAGVRAGYEGWARLGVGGAWPASPSPRTPLAPSLDLNRANDIVHANIESPWHR